MNRQGLAGCSYFALGVMLVAAAAALSLGRPASATTRYWNALDGNWSVPGNWMPFGVPVAGEGVSIGFGDGIARTVTYDVSAPALNSVGVDLTAGIGTTTALSMSAYNLTSNFEYVGYNGRGDFNQSGGTNTIPSGAGFLDVGVLSNSAGTYTLSGTGALVASAHEYIGDVGTGIFNQMGGTNSISGYPNSLYLGYNASGNSGTYNLSAGVLSVGFGEFVGFRVSGTFNQTGGTNIIGDRMQIGGSSGSTGIYTLGGGSLTTPSEAIGISGSGTFIQTAGTNNILTGALLIAANPGSTGTFTLSGGSVNVANPSYYCLVGGIDQSLPGGTGVLNVSGTGMLTVAGTLQIVTTPGTAVNLSGGTINVRALNFNGAPARLNWTGGTLNLTSNVTFDSAAAATTTANAFGPTLTLAANQTLMVTGDETLGGTGPFSLVVDTGSTHYVTGILTLNPAGTITQNAGGTLYANTFTQAGGTVNGTLQNQGLFVYQSGIFNGRLLNQGSVSFGPNFTAGNGVENDATFDLGAGQTLTVNGAGLDNLGVFTLSGGTISGGGPALNDFGGMLVAYGTINPMLTNNGLLKVAGVLRLNGGAANSGFVEGGGTVLGDLANNPGGIIEANNPGAPLALASLQGNSAGSSVEVAAGCLLTINNAWTNSGMVVLQGNNAVLNGAAIANKGAIQGLGNLNSAVVNTGIIEALGGTLIVGGSLSNPAGGLLTASTGNKLFITAGLPANAGIINLTGGTFDNNSHPLDNTGEISGWGIFRTGGTGLDNHGSITFTGGVTTVNGPVTNEGGKTITVAQNPAIFTGMVTNNMTATFNTVNATATFAGGFTDNGNSNFAAVGNGAINVPVAPAFGNASSLAIGGASAMKFNAISGAATVGTGVTATVSSSATLELAGSVSALSSSANRVNIANNSSAAAGILISGTNQFVGNIDGSGNTQVNAGSDLTANHIIQSALVIGGTAGSPALVTIDASDSSGNPLAQVVGQSSDSRIAISLAPSGLFDADTGDSDGTIAELRISQGGSGSTMTIPLSAEGDAGAVTSSTAVPEPATAVLTVIAALACGSMTRRRQSKRRYAAGR